MGQQPPGFHPQATLLSGTQPVVVGVVESFSSGQVL